MPTKERAARERAKRSGKTVQPVANPLYVVTSNDVALEQAATAAAFEALRTLSTPARYRALNWLRAWVNEESPSPEFNP